jgi:hypothetical protein
MKALKQPFSVASCSENQRRKWLTPHIKPKAGAVGGYWKIGKTTRTYLSISDSIPSVLDWKRLGLREVSASH